MWKKAARGACRQAARLWRFARLIDSSTMIIACPACATRYVVPDSAIGLEGRTVRCAKCKHSWFQDGPELAEPIAAAYAVAAQSDDDAFAAPPPSAEAPARQEPDLHRRPRPTPTPSEPARGPEAPAETATPEPAPFTQPRVAAPAFADGEPEDNAARDPAFAEVAPPVGWAPAGSADAGEPSDEISQFDHSPPFRPRRNWLRWLTWGAGAFAVLALAAVAAMSTLGTPSWLPIEQPLFGSDPGLEVEFPASEQERRTLPNGAEFFGARVVVSNTSRETRSVPPLLIVLRDARERVVYSWELVPPQRSLAPGEAMTINEAMTDVPKSAVYADIGWAPR